MEQTQGNNRFELPKFSSTEEELKYLRERVIEKERELQPSGEPPHPKAVVSREVIEYGKKVPEEVLAEHLIIENPQFEHAVERLSTLSHREKMRELYKILAEKGILNALKIVGAQNNPHIEDDFHGVLVEYVKTGGLVPGLDKERELSALLRTTLYEVTLPYMGAQEGSRESTFKEVILAMERFFIGVIPAEGASVTNFGPVSLELVLSNFSNDIVFYIGVRQEMKDLFIQQLLGSFPTAKVEECLKDYNIFNEFGVAVASSVAPSSNFVYPIQFADDAGKDPLTTILNSFTKIERDGEGAAIQLVMYPDQDKLAGKMKNAVRQMRQGVAISRAIDIPLSTGGTVVKSIGDFFSSPAKSGVKEAEPDQSKRDAVEKAITLIDEKLESPIVRTNMRIVVSGPSRERAEAIRTSIEAAFSQFNRPHGGGVKFVHVEKGKLQELLHNFTFRENDGSDALVLNTKELATIYHLPVTIAQHEAPQLKTVKASSAPAPSDLPSEGTLIGVNKYRGESREVRLTKPDRLRHLYTIGQTGTGKSVFLKNLAVQDILAGNGTCFIDPHGSDVQDVLAAVPKERIEDVIYFDPSYTARPLALNMLEYDINHPEQKIFVVNEMLAIFKKLYSSSPESMGPAFEQYFRNATMLVMEDPETGNTLLEIPRVLADPAFRNLKLSRCKNPIVVQFWRDIATKTSGESGLQNMIPYITNKFDVFISNDVMRPIIAQEQSSFNFRDIMDNKKILLVNLAKGKLGEMNANLIGLIIIGKFLMAAMSRVDSFGKELPDFYLYVDEFQNIATPSISAILSEARKYGLSLNLAHQFIAQLPEDIKAAVFGNVGNMIVFRVGTEDAEFLESQFAPIFKASDIMKIENRNAYAKILIHGKPVSPFNLEMLPPPAGHPEIVEQMKNLSYLKFGRDRKLVDDAIMQRYLSTTASKPAEAPKAPAPARAPSVASAGVPPAAGSVPPTPTPPPPTNIPTPAPLPPSPVAPSLPNTPFASAFAEATTPTVPPQMSLPVIPPPLPPEPVPASIVPPVQVPPPPPPPVAFTPAPVPPLPPVTAPVESASVPPLVAVPVSTMVRAVATPEPTPPPELIQQVHAVSPFVTTAPEPASPPFQSHPVDYPPLDQRRTVFQPLAFVTDVPMPPSALSPAVPPTTPPQKSADGETGEGNAAQGRMMTKDVEVGGFRIGETVHWTKGADDLPPVKITGFSPYGDRIMFVGSKIGIPIDEIVHLSGAEGSGPLAQKKLGVTDEAKALVAKADAGGVPLYYTESFKRILAENEIPYQDDMSPSDGIARLREKMESGEAQVVARPPVPLSQEANAPLNDWTTLPNPTPPQPVSQPPSTTSPRDPYREPV